MKDCPSSHSQCSSEQNVSPDPAFGLLVFKSSSANKSLSRGPALKATFCLSKPRSLSTHQTLSRARGRGRAGSLMGPFIQTDPRAAARPARPRSGPARPQRPACAGAQRPHTCGPVARPEEESLDSEIGSRNALLPLLHRLP